VTCIVAPWIAFEAEGRIRNAGPRGDWGVWVEERGCYRLAGVFAGTEAEAIAAAIEKTGATRLTARLRESILSTQTTSPRDVGASGGAATGGES
jgi:hypothetical protein